MKTNDFKVKLRHPFEIGRMGEREIIQTADGGLEVVLGAPFVFDKDNIDDWYLVY